MPPRGSRGGGARGGRGRGAARAGRGGTANRASLDEPERIATEPIETPSQARVPVDNRDLVMQDAPMRETPVDNPSASDVQSDLPATTSARQSQTPSATSSRAAGRFRPKNVRRDAAERARLEAERNRDLAVKIKEEERELREEERRARRGRGRGRGDMPQRGAFMRRTVTASGPFSAIPQENVKGSSSWNGASSSKTDFSPQFTSLRYRPRRENEDRLDTELLSGFTGLTVDGKPVYREPPQYNQKSSGDLPVGLMRTQHEEAEVKVKTTAELEAEEQQSDDNDELFVSQVTKDFREAGVKEDTEVWHAAPKSYVQVKTEPGTEPEEMDVDMSDIPPAVHSPKNKKPVVDKDDAAAAQKRKEKAAKDPEIVQTISDLAVQLETLRSKPCTDGDKEDDEERKLQEKDDQLFLFQLPPILPPLARPTDGATGAAGITNPTSRESSTAATKVKIEDGVEKEKERNPFADLPPEGGLIGKLNVRKSGKVEFDWGGTIMNLGVGTESMFLTTAMMIEQNVDLQNPEQSTGVACGMGEIMNKFVLTPVWDEEEDWDPSLEGIEGLDQ